MILLILIPPIIAGIAVWLYPHKITLREVGLPILAGVLALLITYFVGTRYATSDTEYLSGLVTTAEYFEAWNERVSCRHTKYCTNSKGERYSCGTEHPYDVDYHPERWVISDTNGFSKETNKVGWESFNWSSKKVDLNRRYHTIDGDKFVKAWDGERASARLLVTPHRYQNKAATLYRWEGEEYEEKLNHVGYTPSVVGGAPEAFDYLNGKYGATKQLRVLVHILPSIEDAMALEQSMRGGNKNELVICTNEAASYAYCFSWTDSRLLLAEIEGYIIESGLEQGKLDLEGLAKFIEGNLSGWERKQFSDFVWVIVDPPTWVLVLSALTTTLVSIAVSALVIKEEVC